MLGWAIKCYAKALAFNTDGLPRFTWDAGTRRVVAPPCSRRTWVFERECMVSSGGHARDDNRDVTQRSHRKLLIQGSCLGELMQNCTMTRVWQSKGHHKISCTKRKLFTAASLRQEVITSNQTHSLIERWKSRLLHRWQELDVRSHHRNLPRWQISEALETSPIGVCHQKIGIV